MLNRDTGSREEAIPSVCAWHLIWSDSVESSAVTVRTTPACPSPAAPMSDGPINALDALIRGLSDLLPLAGPPEQHGRATALRS